MTIADLLGRRRVMIEYRFHKRRKQPPAPNDPIFELDRPVRLNQGPMGDPFLEAVEDLAKREPFIAEPVAESGIPKWRQVADNYQEGGFGLARSSDEVITRRVQKALEDVVGGTGDSPQPTAEQTKEIIQEIGDWSDAYVDTVYETNLNSAYTNGRFEQAKDPDVRKVIGAFEYFALLDGEERENHAAAHGLVAHMDDAIWETVSPPNGYRCRCAVRMLDKFTLERRGLLDENGQVQRFIPPSFSGFAPDPGFEASSRVGG